MLELELTYQSPEKKQERPRHHLGGLTSIENGTPLAEPLTDLAWLRGCTLSASRSPKHCAASADAALRDRNNCSNSSLLEPNRLRAPGGTPRPRQQQVTLPCCTRRVGSHRRVQAQTKGGEGGGSSRNPP